MFDRQLGFRGRRPMTSGSRSFPVLSNGLLLLGIGLLLDAGFFIHDGRLREKRTASVEKPPLQKAQSRWQGARDRALASTSRIRVAADAAGVAFVLLGVALKLRARQASSVEPR